MVDINFKVSVRCFTYNHVNFIEDAMNGFCMQATTFPFVCCIVDDASTDGTPDMINNYLKDYFELDNNDVVEKEESDNYFLTFAQHKTNRNCFFLVVFLKFNHYKKIDKIQYIEKWDTIAKYVAMCEGDDYWISPQKLEKQVEFLDNHEDYSMIFHRAQIIKNIEVSCGLECEDICDREYNPNELIESWKVPTASIVLKREVLHIENVGTERVLNGDVILVLNSAKIGKIRGISETLSVYRVQAGGVTYDRQLQHSRLMRYPYHFKFIKENYPFIDNSIINKKIAIAYINRGLIRTNFALRLKDFILAFWNCPSFFFRKIGKIFHF